MRTRISWLILLCGILVVLSIAAEKSTAENHEISYLPPDSISKKIRIGYVESEEYFNFPGTLYALIQGLTELGWLENTEDLPYRVGQDNSSEMWAWLANRDIGPYIEFVEDVHYSLLGADYTAEDVIRRLNSDQDIDFMIVMGTVAGKALAIEDHNTAMMVFSSSNAVEAGIINSAEDSGLDHVWAHMDSGRYKRQVEVFYDIFEFEKMGMLFENSEVGRVYAAVEEAKEVADDRGFTIVERYVDEANGAQDQTDRYYPEVKRNFEELANEVDAVYLTVGTWELEALPDLLEPFFEKNIPVFSQLGTEEVAYGALMSVARQDFTDVGRFGAANMGRIFNGEAPRRLEQEFGHTPAIVLNLESAEQIEYEPPFEILLVADEIYQNIKDK